MRSVPKVVATAIAYFFFPIVSAPQSAGNGPPACSLARLPVELQTRLQAEFASWRLQEISDLSPNAKGRWQAEKPLSCPGVAVGRFEKMSETSYAILLV